MLELFEHTRSFRTLRTLKQERLRGSLGILLVQLILIILNSLPRMEFLLSSLSRYNPFCLSMYWELQDGFRFNFAVYSPLCSALDSICPFEDVQVGVAYPQVWASGAISTGTSASSKDSLPAPRFEALGCCITVYSLDAF